MNKKCPHNCLAYDMKFKESTFSISLSHIDHSKIPMHVSEIYMKVIISYKLILVAFQSETVCQENKFIHNTRKMILEVSNSLKYLFCKIYI